MTTEKKAHGRLTDKNRDITCPDLPAWVVVYAVVPMLIIKSNPFDAPQSPQLKKRKKRKNLRHKEPL